MHVLEDQQLSFLGILLQNYFIGDAGSFNYAIVSLHLSVAKYKTNKSAKQWYRIQKMYSFSITKKRIKLHLILDTAMELSFSSKSESLELTTTFFLISWSHQEESLFIIVLQLIISQVHGTRLKVQMKDKKQWTETMHQ